MNFFQFLEKPIDKKTTTTTAIPEKETVGEIEQSFTRGNFIVVVGLEKSPFNIYKGYKGQIKEYMKGNNYAMVHLEASNGPQLKRMDIRHLKRIYYT